MDGAHLIGPGARLFFGLRSLFPHWPRYCARVRTCCGRVVDGGGVHLGVSLHIYEGGCGRLFVFFVFFIVLYVVFVLEAAGAAAD